MKGLLCNKLKAFSNQPHGFDGIRFSFKTLKAATNNFSCKIRENNFSISYKGILKDCSTVAVKVLKKKYNARVFYESVRIMSTIRHRNVVQLIGYCIKGERRIIVHEFVGEYTLRELLFTESVSDRSKLDWPLRASILIGIIRGLEYLINGASPGIVNRDVKPGNVLLDKNFNPKITDFEIASFLIGGDDDDDFYIQDRICGTYGYIDPEYRSTGRFTKKTDVYSFGVVVLEVVAGRKLTSNDLNEMVRGRGETGSGFVQEFVDPALAIFPEDMVMRFIDVAVSCIQPSSLPRPSMFEVWLMCSDYNNTKMQELGAKCQRIGVVAK